MQSSEKYAHNIGETVVYRKQGIYEIKEIKEQKIGNEKKEYYVLSSVYDANSAVYVPVDNLSLTSQIENTLSKEEIHAIIDADEGNDVFWLENTTERAIHFDEILKSGNLLKILSLLNMFIERKNNADKKPYRNFARDEKAFSAALKAVTEAFAYPLGIPKTEVVAYITNRKNNLK